MIKTAKRLMFILSALVCLSFSAFAGSSSSNVDCQDPISFSLNFDEVVWSNTSKMTGVIVGTKSSFSYDIIQPVAVKGLGEVAMEELSIVDHSFDWELVGSYFFEGWVMNSSGKAEYVSVWTNAGVISLSGQTPDQSAGATLTVFEDDNQDDRDSRTGPLLPRYQFSAEGFAWIECHEFELVGQSSCTYYFEQASDFSSSHMSSKNFLCDDAPATAGLVPHTIDLVENTGDDSIKFSSENYTLECPVQEGTILGALLEFQIPEKVISPGVLTRFYAIPEVDDCVLYDSAGNQTSWDGTSMATPAGR